MELYSLNLEKTFFILILWNFIAFWTMGWDKRQARRQGPRAAERTLLMMAFLFGAAGILTGMLVFRHKTRHWSFRLGIPVLLIANGWLLYRLWLGQG